MKKLLYIGLALLSFTAFGQSNDCDQAVPGCSTPSFPVNAAGTGNVIDFTSGSGSNPSTNPNPVPGNTGCLLTGETTSTFITISVTSTGTLEWSLQGAGGTGFFDWIMWPYTPGAGGAVSPTCAMLQNGTQPPVACNWNASSAGFTGMAATGNLPAGANQGNFELGLNVVAGETYLLCLSNFSGTNQNVNLDFFGTAQVTCGASAPDQTICLGDTATVDINTQGMINPTFNWLVTNNVSNTTGGTGVLVNPSVTTTYDVEITDAGGPGGATVDTISFTITVVDPPVVNAGMDQTICLGDVMNMAATATDPVNNTMLWTWSAPGINPAPNCTFAPNFSDPNTVVTADQPGTYTFVYSEDNGVCPAETDTMIVVIDDLIITADSVTPSCEGFADGEIHIDAPGAVQYSFDNGVTWQADSFATIFTAGTYDVCGITALGCQKCTQVTVVDPAPVVVSVSNDTLICENGTASLLASATGGTTYLFNWDHTASTLPNQDVSPSSASTYTVVAENENGCLSLPASIDVTIRPPLTGTITPWDTMCPGYPVDVTATVTGGLGQPYDFVWTSGQTQNGPAMHTINVNPAVTTDYTVTITDGCESTPLVMMTNVRVAPLPVPQINVLNPVQCEPAVFDIVNTTDPTLSAFNYWLVDGQHGFVNQDTISTPPLYAGDYDVQLVVTTYEGCVDSVTFTDVLHVDPKPVADFKYTPNPVLMFNTQVHFTNYSFNGYTYEWTFEDGVPSTSTQKNVDVLFPDGVEGRYDVQLITTSELGCKDTLLHELVVFPEVLIYAPNTFTPDGDEHNQDWQVYMEGVDVYDFELLIFDRWGEVIWESKDLTVPWDGTYNGRPLPTGMYTWVIRTKDMINDNKYTYNGHINLLR